MDVPRIGASRKRLIRRIIWGVVLISLVAAVSVGLGRLTPKAMEVEWSTLWPDKVKRGLMLRQVRGIGTLVAEDTLFVPAMTDGRVESILIRPGTPVKSDDVIVTLSNPELVQQTLDAQFQVKMAEARHRDLEVKLESETLDMKAQLSVVEAAANQARLRLDRDETLFREKLIIELTYKLVKAEAEQSAKRLALERERIAMRSKAVEAQLQVSRSGIEQLQALYELKKSQVEGLKVRAGVVGMLQELPVQVGQRLAAGAVIAKVAQPQRLKAELKVPETQVKDVAIGQKAEIDTRNGFIMGRVIRIDPAAREGTVTVDVKFDEKLPDYARPDLSVDGNIEVERLNNAVFVGRPASGQPDSLSSLFRVDPDGKGAHRVQVRFGKASVNTIEVVQGLNVGDQVILSDMSNVDGQDRIAFK
ncbi:MAG TPA: HlyD family efflux transporter periplasmic adaptor subunit [Bryobacteraceae bacterium]|nr:HlyD family efflux transporter periplasmic adaptor subunit [Bryobacteraceae bacterium]